MNLVWGFRSQADSISQTFVPKVSLFGLKGIVSSSSACTDAAPCAVAVNTGQRPSPQVARQAVLTAASTAPCWPGRERFCRMLNRVTGSRTNPRGARQWARELAPRPCIRLGPPGTRTMKQPFASTARLRAAGTFFYRHRSHGSLRVTATSDCDQRPATRARPVTEIVLSADPAIMPPLLAAARRPRARYLS
jgi:hypothetical protein